MKKKISYTLTMILTLVISTACQPIEQAIEDTFGPVSEHKTLPDGKEESLFFEAEEPSFFEISDDIAYKLGLADDAFFIMDLWTYVQDNEIKDYVSQEQAEAILEEYNKQFLMLNPDEVVKVLEKLGQDLGSGDVYIKDGSISINQTSLSLVVHSQQNPREIDSYTYSSIDGEWTIVPRENLDAENPLEYSYPLADLPIDKFHTVVDQSLQILKEMGAYNEDFYYKNSETSEGMTDLDLGYNIGDGGLQFEVSLASPREKRTITFDQDGNIINQER